MFKRKNKQPFLKRVQEAAWPSMGWGRYGTMLWLRLKRVSVQASNTSVAAGLSFGWLISFNPLLGTHTIWILVFSFIFGFNFIAAMIGSLVGNVWTFPALLWVSYQVGDFILHLFNMSAQSGFGNSLMVMMIGWPFIGVASFLVSYPIYYYLVKSIKQAYIKAKQLRERNKELK
ncbi:MAG: hypothetical protein CMH30_05280 [Micavibrio sp.]|nr:hypothetical protein [Micavibrio sp.]